MTRQRITVRATNARPTFTGGGDSLYRSARAWAVYRDHERIPGAYVVDGESPSPFRTLILDGEMVTVWHLGLRPGDVARRYLPEVLP